MNKKKTANLTLVVLVLVILSLIGVSGTYAKYTTAVNGKGTAIVAKWDFKATAGTTTLEEDFEIDLGDYVTSGLVTVNGVKKIQPGSKGEITINIDNTNSDVAATLDVQAVSQANDKFTKSQFSFGKVVLVDDGGNTITEVAAGDTATAKISFEWKYDSSVDADAEDTIIGKNATDTAMTLVTLKVVGTQVNV